MALPTQIVSELGLKPGDQVDFVRNRKGRFEVVPKTRTMADIKGIVRHKGPPLSDDDIVAVVKAGRDKRAEHVIGVLKKAGFLPEKQG